MKNSRKRLLAGMGITPDLKSENFTESELAEFRKQRDPVYQRHLADAEMAERRRVDMEETVARLKEHGPGLLVLDLGTMPRGEIEALAVKLSQDACIACRYLDRALEEIELLRADLEAEYGLAQALLRQRDGL